MSNYRWAAGPWWGSYIYTLEPGPGNTDQPQMSVLQNFIQITPLITSPIQTSQSPTTQSPQSPTTQSPQNPTTQSPQSPTTQSPQNPTTQSPQNPTTQSPQNPTTQSPQNPTTQSHNKNNNNHCNVKQYFNHYLLLQL